MTDIQQSISKDNQLNIKFVKHSFDYCSFYDNNSPTLLEQYWTSDESRVEFQNIIVSFYSDNGEFGWRKCNNIFHSISHQARKEYLAEHQLHKQLYPHYDQLIISLIGEKNIYPLKFNAINICDYDPRYHIYWSINDKYNCHYTQYVSRQSESVMPSISNTDNTNDYYAWYIECIYFENGPPAHVTSEMNTAYDEFWRERFICYKWILLLSCGEMSNILPREVIMYIAQFYAYRVLEDIERVLDNIS